MYNAALNGYFFPLSSIDSISQWQQVWNHAALVWKKKTQVEFGLQTPLWLGSYLKCLRGLMAKSTFTALIVEVQQISGLSKVKHYQWFFFFFLFAVSCISFFSFFFFIFPLCRPCREACGKPATLYIYRVYFVDKNQKLQLVYFKTFLLSCKIPQKLFRWVNDFKQYVSNLSPTGRMWSTITFYVVSKM